MSSTQADWSRLTEWLLTHNTEAHVVISWDDLDAIVGGMPESATKHYPQWWQGDRSHTRAWRKAGYEFERVDLGRIVTFKRSTIVSRSQTARHAESTFTAARTFAPGSPDHDRVQRFSLVELQTIEPRSALIVLPCSGSKASGGTSQTETAPSFWAPELQRARAQIHVAARVDERQVMPAWKRYTGGFYTTAGSALARAVSDGGHLAILSGGYGVIRADENIGTYDKQLKPKDWPSDVLESALLAEATRVGAEEVVAFAASTTGYAQIIRHTPWHSVGVRRAVLVTIQSSGGGAMSKVPRDLGLAFSAFWNGESNSYPSSVLVEKLK